MYKLLGMSCAIAKEAIAQLLLTNYFIIRCPGVYDTCCR